MSELIALLFDLVRTGHAHFGHQLYAPLKNGRGFGVVLLGVQKGRTISRIRPHGGRIFEHLCCNRQSDGNLTIRLCPATRYLDVRDASDSAGMGIASQSYDERSVRRRRERCTSRKAKALGSRSSGWLNDSSG